MSFTKTIKGLLSLVFFCFSLPSASSPRVSIELDSARVTGVEILVADEGAQIQSSFGHALLRLVDADGLWANDTVVSFAANVQGEINPVTGIVGGYEVAAEVKTLQEYWEFYSKKFDRGFKRYPVNMSAAELSDFLAALERHVRRPEQFGDYKFITNNCVSIITRIFNEAGVGADREDFHNIPRSVNEWIDANVVSAFEPLATSVFKSVKKHLNDSPNMDYGSLAKSLNDRELAYVYLNHHGLDFATMDALARRLEKNKVDVDDIYGLAPLPEILYTKNFGEEFHQAELAAFGPKAKENQIRRFVFKKDFKFSKTPLAAETAPLFLESRLLFKAPKKRGDRLKRFSINSLERRGETRGGDLEAVVIFRGKSNTMGSGYQYTIKGVNGELTQIGSRAYKTEDGGYLRLIETRDGVELYIFK